MVAEAVGRSTSPGPVHRSEEEILEPGLRENLVRQLSPLLTRLKNRWVMLILFLMATTPFAMSWLNAYQDFNQLQERINAQEAVLALPEPRTDDIEEGLRSWTAALEAAQGAQVIELHDSELLEKFIAASNTVGVEILSVSTSSNVLVPVDVDVYDATPILLRIGGEIAAIESFIALIEADAVEALEVQNSLIAPTEEGDFIAVIRSIVFNRPVDPSLLAEDELQELSRRVTDAELDAAAGRTPDGGASQ